MLRRQVSPREILAVIPTGWIFTDFDSRCGILDVRRGTALAAALPIPRNTAPHARQPILHCRRAGGRKLRLSTSETEYLLRVCNGSAIAAFYTVELRRISFRKDSMADDSKQMTVRDEQLVLATLRGETSAFGTIVERYWKMVVAMALTRAADPAEAEDVAQESFLKAYSQLHSLRDPSRFAGWLSKITRQQCSNSVRRSVRCKSAFGCKATPLHELDAKPAEAPSPGLTQSQVHFVRETVRRLPEKVQSLIVMRFVAGLSAVQIAEQLGKRPGTVRVRLHRAYKILRKDLAWLLEEVES